MLSSQTNKKAWCDWQLVKGWKQILPLQVVSNHADPLIYKTASETSEAAFCKWASASTDYFFLHKPLNIKSLLLFLM